MLKNARFHICTLGEPLVEFSYEGRELFSRGYSGDCVNVAVAASRLGLKAAVVASLGNDAMGTWLKGRVREEHIGVGSICLEEGTTGIYFITLGKGGKHAFTYYRKNSPASRMKLSDRQLRTVEQSSIFHTSGITQAIGEEACAAVHQAARRAKDAGTAVSFDVNFRPSLTSSERAYAELKKMSGITDILFISTEDYAYLLGKKRTAVEIGEEMQAQGFSNVVVKDGSKGAFSLFEGRRVAVQSFRIKAVDATGAGDAFDAGMLYGVIADMDTESAMEFAAGVAALKCLKKGGTAGLPALKQVRAFLKNAARRSPGRHGMGIHRKPASSQP